ncbi:U1 small nuclear ribonucleoprotein 70 kDa isoform X3 [Neodiprion virginianus]|uniref:U1 small nuclear ribonucleoprotein 70 kDa isoform X3 n=1 Tax=Neodiprion virginianus TaxID=2961670 RepID=UPI001EE6DF9A|nr:U1 small nuclear ribonucleoprotein 70 kDa isoform X3 [Neodiprion virginianus]
MATEFGGNCEEELSSSLRLYVSSDKCRIFQFIHRAIVVLFFFFSVLRLYERQKCHLIGARILYSDRKFVFRRCIQLEFPRYENRYDRDRVYDRDPGYDRNYDRGYYERGNGYDNLDSRYPYESREDVRYYSPSRRPSYYEDPYVPRYDRRNRYGNRYEQSYDRYDPYDRIYSRKPAVDDRYIYDRFGSRGGSAGGIGYGGGAAGGGGGYFASGSSGSWGPGYDRGYASAWNYAGSRDRDRDRDNWRDRDFNRDRDPGYYRPRDYFYDSTAAPGASRGTSYLHDRPESSTPSNSIGQESATNSPKSQDTNKVYKD